MKKLTTLTLIALLMLLIGGCTMLERQEYEKRISRVSEVYPTEKVSDLFKKFPGGFSIYHVKDEAAGNKAFSHEVTLYGDSNTKSITGKYLKKTVGGDVLIEIPVLYDDNNTR